MRAKLLVLVMGLLLGWFMRAVFFEEGQEAAAGGPLFGGEKAGCCQGDVNGDGKLNISDAIYLLRYLFVDGPAPACLPVTCALPATGQTKCFDRLGNEIPCDSAEYPGQDGFYQAGCPMEGRFVDNGDGTVTDTCTGLMWQQATAPGKYIWQEALQYCEKLILCNDGTWTTDPEEAARHGGIKYDDWRLPNVRELQSIVDYDRAGSAIDPLFEGASGWCWSSSTHVFDPRYAWGVHFGLGVVGDSNKWNSYFVRAVRSGL